MSAASGHSLGEEDRVAVALFALGCGFATLQQCLDSLSGTAGSCARDPFYDPGSALAYQPKQGHSHSGKTAPR